jgi:hypothetical protein
MGARNRSCDVEEEHPEERSPGGARTLWDPNRFQEHRTRRGEQGLEVEGSSAGQRWAVSTARRHDAAGESRYGSATRDKPLEGKPWTWLRDETSPRRWLAEQTVEGVRNAADGTRGREWDPGPSVDAGFRCRDEGSGTPRKALHLLFTGQVELAVGRSTLEETEKLVGG